MCAVLQSSFPPFRFILAVVIVVSAFWAITLRSPHDIAGNLLGVCRSVILPAVLDDIFPFTHASINTFDQVRIFLENELPDTTDRRFHSHNPAAFIASFTVRSGCHHDASP